MEIKKGEIVDEIRNYNPHAEKVTLSTLMMINQKVNILNIGKSGTGKSRGSTELLELIKIHYTLINGHITPKAFFEILQNDGYILFDESAIVLSNKTILNLLLNALWGKKIEWKNGRELLEHEFKGQIIFNTNEISNNRLVMSLIDRLQANHIELNKEQIREKMESRNSYKPNLEI